MATDREIRETIARCVSSIVYYDRCGRTAQAREVFEADVALVREWLDSEGMAGAEVVIQILAPVLSELSDRYESAEAAILHGEFVAALRFAESSPDKSGEHLVYQG